MIKSIIIDDDRISADLISCYISKVEDMELQEIFFDSLRALSYIGENTVQLAFIDIEMPNLGGIDFIEISKKHNVSFIIISSHKEYAVKGYDLDVVDFLQKPITFPRFLKAVDKYKKTSQLSLSSPIESKGSDLIFLKTNKRLVKYNKSEISYIEAVGDYVNIFVGKEKITVHSTMTDIIKQFSQPNFLRVNRSYIVNVSKINNIEDNTILINDVFIPIGKTYKDILKKRINAL